MRIESDHIIIPGPRATSDSVLVHPADLQIRRRILLAHSQPSDSIVIGVNPNHGKFGRMWIGLYSCSAVEDLTPFHR